MDILICGGTVYDGSGGEPFRADVLVRGDRIAAIGQGLSSKGARIINAARRAVTPGFVDIHRHCDTAPFLKEDFGEIELAQGITSTLVGNCGLSPVPTASASRAEQYQFLEPVTGAIPESLVFESYSDYKNALEKAALPINMGFFTAAGSIKTAIKGFSRAPYTEHELWLAEEHVREGMSAGAFGITLGIMYQPECYSTAAELSRVVRPAALAGGLLCTHIRGEGDSLISSVQEVIDIARRAEIRLNISHFKATGTANWNGQIFRAIELIEAARAAGQEVSADFYPYDGGSTTLQSLLPPCMLEESNSAAMQKLGTREGAKRLCSELSREHTGWDNMAKSIGWERILISSVTLPEHLHMQGRDMLSLAREQGRSDPGELAAELLSSENGRVGIIVLSMSQSDVDEVARLPWTALISDALYGGGNPHPRLYGAFPKFLREYVAERGVLSFPEAIRKMTALPAERAGLVGRGLLCEGNAADILVFDPKLFCDHAGYTGSHAPASGMEHVILGGVPVLHDGVVQVKNSGRVLSR